MLDGWLCVWSPEYFFLDWQWSLACECNHGEECLPNLMPILLCLPQILPVLCIYYGNAIQLILRFLRNAILDLVKRRIDSLIILWPWFAEPRHLWHLIIKFRSLPLQHETLLIFLISNCISALRAKGCLLDCEFFFSNFELLIWLAGLELHHLL